MESLRGKPGATAEDEKQRLRKATQEFESVFIYQMLKTMRKTIPEGSLGEGSPLSGASGKDMFTDMFDMELARNMSMTRGSSIAEMLYNSMEKLIEAQYDSGGDGVGAIGPIPLEGETPPAKPIRSDPVRLEPRSLQPLEIGRRQGAPLPLERQPGMNAEKRIVADYGQHIRDAARKTSLDPALIMSVIKAESYGDPEAVSHAGAKGLMQLMDSTATQYQVTSSFDPGQNIDAGARYLRDLVDRFGDVKLALAAYNAGPETVTKHGGIPPFKETQEYVRRVLDTFASVRGESSGHIAKVRSPGADKFGIDAFRKTK